MGTITITDRTNAAITLTGVERAAYDKIRESVIDGQDLAFENPDDGRAITYAPKAVLKVEWVPEDQPAQPAAAEGTDTPQE